jgi:hypothetical protein
LSKCEFHEDLKVVVADLVMRVTKLEVNDAAQSERVNSLCQKIEDLTKTIQNWMNFAQNLFWKVIGVSGGIIILFAGFFFWYVQSLPR